MSRKCSNCFWHEKIEGNDTCIFNTLCNKSFDKSGEFKYHIHPYEARRLLGDILLDMDRAYNRHDDVFGKLISKGVIK